MPQQGHGSAQRGTFLQPPCSPMSFYLLGKTLRPVLRTFSHYHELLLSTVRPPDLQKATLVKHDLCFRHWKKVPARSKAAGAAGGCCSPGPTLPAAVWGGCANQAAPPTRIPPRHPKAEPQREDTDPGVNIILVATAPRAFQMSPPSVMHLF